MCTVVNKYKSEVDVYIGRGSRWGNPFTTKTNTKAEFIVATTEDSVALYKEYLIDLIRKGIITIDDLLALDGKRLGCFCKPKICHGDIINEWWINTATLNVVDYKTIGTSGKIYVVMFSDGSIVNLTKVTSNNDWPFFSSKEEISDRQIAAINEYFNIKFPT